MTDGTPHPHLEADAVARLEQPVVAGRPLQRRPRLRQGPARDERQLIYGGGQGKAVECCGKAVEGRWQPWKGSGMLWRGSGRSMMGRQWNCSGKARAFCVRV